MGDEFKHCRYFAEIENKNGDFIWRDGLTVDAPSTLLGRPVYYLETMPIGGAGKAVLAFGDFKRGYYIVDHETGVRTAQTISPNRAFIKFIRINI